MPDLRVIPAHRDPDYVQWVMERFPNSCVVCGGRVNPDGFSTSGPVFAHPPRRRPYIGRTGDSFSPSKGKPSDYGGLRVHDICHKRLHSGEAVVLDEDWNAAVQRNLIAYMRERDPGVDLGAEMLEFAQDRVGELRP